MPPRPLTMELNVGHLVRVIAAEQPDSPCIVTTADSWTWAEFDERTDRFAASLVEIDAGCSEDRRGPGPPHTTSPHARVGLYLHNGPEYLEAMVGAFKARAVGVNINYRYLADELRFVLDDSSAEVVVVHSEFSPTLQAVRQALPRLREIWQVPDSSGLPLLEGARWYGSVLAQAEPQRSVALDPELRGDDHYLCYTGGTTGMPKGVIWRQEDFLEGALGMDLRDSSGAHERSRLLAGCRPGRLRALPAPPFMHGAAHWNALSCLVAGGAVCIQRHPERLDPVDIWSTAERCGATSLLIVGDAFAGPLVAELRAAADRGRPYRLESLRHVLSGGATLSPVNRDALLELLPRISVVDVLGSSESGRAAITTTPGPGAAPGAPASPGVARTPPPGSGFRPGERTVILTADRTALLQPGETASGPPGGEPRPGAGAGGTIGWLALSGPVPLGYLGAAAKTAETFPVVGGRRYSVPGDRARWNDSGGIDLLGRDSACVNTGGEKVFVEEVESCLRAHPAVLDALVCGRPSERWGAEVVAVVALRDPHALGDDSGPGAIREPAAGPARGSGAPAGEAAATPDTDLVAELTTWCKQHLAGYKAPKAILLRGAVARSASGKPDYAWAREQFGIA